MRLDDFAAFMVRICSHSAVAPGRVLRWAIIANPGAGGFTIASRWKRHREVLNEAALQAEALNPARPGSGPASFIQSSGGPLVGAGLIATGGPGDAGRTTESLIREISAGREGGAFYLIICAGGDGTSGEALAALFAAPGEARNRCAVLRLPLGTGNDGADSWDLQIALDLLIAPSRVELAPALKLITASEGKGPFLAFNVLSIGLDAFVTHMTNKMKGKLPGDSYKLWVDIASLLYDLIYHVGLMDVTALDAGGNTVQKLRETLLLLAVGASGRRTYGSRKHILPDDRNVCLVRQMSLLRKIAIKDKFTSGSHINEKEALLFNASRIEFTGEYPILAQMDGEAVLLQKQDFPAAIELTGPVIPVLKNSF